MPTQSFVSRLFPKLTSYSFKVGEIFVLLITFLLIATAVGAAFLLQPYFEEVRNERMSNFWGSLLWYISVTLLIFKLLFLGYLFYLYNKYKATKAVDNNHLPTCTVIVPAYNEGKLVYETLLSIANTDYPSEKLQILSLDDGSKDDTWFWMQQAKKELGDRVTILQQPKNMGKRHALYRGFHLGTGEVFVTIDSDSLIEYNTLKNLVSPFVSNPLCGAVAGNVKVLNAKDSLIPRMLNVSFAYSFEFIRSAQSVLGSVLCTPGALAAYKRDAVMHCLEDWMQQTFMGNPSDIGEDRAMTNMILKQGYHVVFQKNAIVLTNTPEKYKNLYKMFIRWERSNVRENIMMSKFAFANFREGSKIGTRVILLNQWLNVVMSYPILLMMLFFVITHPIIFLSTTLIGILIFSSIQAIFYAMYHQISDSLWAYPYSLFYTFTLFWITPYAIATANKSGWLTRG